MYICQSLHIFTTPDENKKGKAASATFPIKFE